MEILVDRIAELAVIGTIYQLSAEIFHDIDPLLNPNSFAYEECSLMYSVFKQAFAEDSECNLDFATVMSAAASKGVKSLIDREMMKEAKGLATSKKNAISLAAKIRKLEIARVLDEQLKSRRDKVQDLTGAESVEKILSLSEFDLCNLFAVEGGPTAVGDDIVDMITERMENPIEQIGISTGYPAYDQSIGGGLRGGSVNIIGARSGVGKSAYLLNVSIHIAKQLGIPVLYLDTEMRKEEQQYRALANLAKVEIGEIETGKAGKDPAKKDKVLKAAKSLEDAPWWHYSIAGMSFEEQISLMNLWFRKNVGFEKDGSPKKCMIVYDYIKLMSSDSMSEMAEFQVLGFMMTALHNFAVKYDLPILSAIQLNRDGITKETSDVVSGSDRILWLATSLAIYKHKSDEELADEQGNMKLSILKSRHGKGLSYPHYINYTMHGKYALINEGIVNGESGEVLEQGPIEF